MKNKGAHDEQDDYCNTHRDQWTGGRACTMCAAAAKPIVVRPGDTF